MEGGSGLWPGVPQLAPGALIEAGITMFHNSPGREPGDTGPLGETGLDRSPRPWLGDRPPRTEPRPRAHTSPGREPGDTGPLGETGRDRPPHPRLGDRPPRTEPRPRAHTSPGREPGDTGPLGETGLDRFLTVRCAVIAAAFGIGSSTDRRPA